MIIGHREKTVTGVFWSVIEQFGIVFVKLVLGIILARLLMPSDFGIIGMITVFFDVANEIVQGGFAQAYIQKKDTSEKDAATVLYFNIFLSILIYIVLWFSAPYIASFYNQPQLLLLIRIMAVVVIIDAVAVIRIVTIMREVDFKRKTLIMIISTSLSGIISIVLAYKGFGVWSLVWYAFLNKLFNTIGLWMKTKWLPIKNFSFTSFKEMFTFGIWLLFSAVLGRIIENINILIIGKVFPVAQLGFYTKAKQFQQMASGQIIQAVSVVAFPVLSIMQTDKERLKEGVKMFLQQTLLVVFPIILTLFVVAQPFVIIFLTAKWEPMIIYLKLFCIIGTLFPINSINSLVLVAQGHSKLNFRLSFFYNSLRLINVFIMYRFGVYYIILGEVFISVISLFVNTYFTWEKIDYGLLEQISDLKYYLIGGIIATASGLSIYLFFDNLYLLFTIASFTTISVFFIFQYLFNKESFEVALSLKEKLIKKFKSEKPI